MFKFLSYTFLTVLTVDILATTGDITMTWTSPILTKLYSNNSDINPFDHPITSDEDSWIGSLINIGAIVGPFPYGFISAKFGRKVSLLLIAIPHAIAYLTFAFSKTIYWYYFARVLGGIAVGGGYTLLPMYIAEISEDSSRGMLSVTLNIFWAFGNLIPYIIGPYTSVLCFNVILACIPALFFILFFIIAPESPYYLAMKNKEIEAEKVLMKLRSHDKKVVANELAQIKFELQNNTAKVSVAEFFKSKIYMKGLYISVILLVAQQLSGVNVVSFYTEEIFKEAGITSLKPEVCAMITGFVGFLSSFGVPLIVDRFGRRPLLMFSLIGVAISHTAFGTYFYLKFSTNVDVSPVSWLPVLILVGYVLTFNVGWASLPWTVSSELFPTSVKSYAASIVSSSCWITSFIVTKFFNDLKESMGVEGVFWLFGGCCLAGAIFIFFCVPETKNKSFQEIQDILKTNQLK